MMGQPHQRSVQPRANLNEIHDGQVRSIRFCSESNGAAPTVLTASYDMTLRIGSFVNGPNNGMTIVGRHSDKVVQARWHPYETDAFVSTSADRTCVVWRRKREVNSAVGSEYGQ
ncbi:hypothetical protein ACOME3_006673 [Neoechinorhynchus agilis]